MVAGCLMASTAFAVPTGEPAITFHSSAFTEIGEGNLSSFLLGTVNEAEYTVVDASGERKISFVSAGFDPSSADFTGSWIQIKVPQSGEVKIYGDPANIDVIVAEGMYITSVDMPEVTNLQILQLKHNALRELDLTPFTRLQAIYLSDNPFTAETPLKVGAPKNDLQILEIDIIDHLDQSFNLSDYPSLVAFDGYHNMDLYNVDPTGCPNLKSLSVELTPCSSLDLSQNPLLQSLNISESRITSIDISHNPRLLYFFAGHESGSVNTGYRLESLDLSHNPMLQRLDISGNYLGTVDLSANTALTALLAKRNGLTSIDLSANTALNSVNIMFNDMDFATLPSPRESWVEYFYKQNAMPVAKSIQEGSTIDLASRVLRNGTQTIARVWKMNYSGEAEVLDESFYTYADGKVTFPQAMADSVYVEFTNNLLYEYTLVTTPFMVKTASEFGKPSRILTFTSAGSGEMAFSVGMQGASQQTPKTFFVDFGDGVLKEFETNVALGCPEVPVVKGVPVGQVAVYIPENEVMTSLYIDGMPLAAIDLTAATELVELSLTDCGLYDVDLRYNRCLASLDISGNNLSSLDLQGIYGDYEKNVLADIRAARNRISSFHNIATRATVSLDLSDNQLTEIELKDYDSLKELDLSGNLLTSIDLAYMLSATDIDLSRNSLTSVASCPTNVAENFNVSDNNLSYGTMPLPSEMGANYVYAPQKQIVIAAEAPTVNLSRYAVEAGGNPTEFVWKKTDGTVLVKGTDYTENAGLTSFLDADLGSVYCELLNASFPAMTGDDVLRTTETVVTGRPTQLVASFKTVGLTDRQPSIIFAATEPTQVYIDWKGDGSELVGYDVNTSYIEYPVESIYPGADVKIYAVDAETVSAINVFSIYNITLDDVDLSPLKGAYAISLSGTGLDETQLTMPVCPGLGELNLEGNRFTSFPYGADYPNLATLNLAENLLESFDFADVPNVGYIALSKNKLTELDVNSDNVWSIFADGNLIENVTFTNAPSLGQLLLPSNRLDHIDIEPVKNTLYALSLVGNMFTFATLPLQSDYPALSVYYYGNQTPMDADCVNGQVDLSAQAVIGGNTTGYAWYVGVPEYNPDTQQLEGTLLEEGKDYTIDNGVTTFIVQPAGEVLCVMTNSTFPNLVLNTNLIEVRLGSIDGITSDADAEIEVYTIDGVFVGKGRRDEVTADLAPGVYVAGGRKILVK